MTKLANCPFCGGDMPYIEHNPQQAITYILCDDCGAITSFRPRLIGSQAIDAWNKRAPQGVLQ